MGDEYPVSSRQAQSDELSSSLLGIMALGTAFAIANNYLAQPLVAVIGREFQSEAGAYVPVASQMGYVLGLFLLVPLGDMFERRRLIVGQFVLLSVALLALALAPDASSLLAAALLIGIAATATQQLIPFAANLAGRDRLGMVVGLLGSAGMTGVLLSRTAAGFIAETYGWRTVFGCASPVALGVAVWLARRLPRNEPVHAVGYGALLRSLVELWCTTPALRLTALNQALTFAASAAFWTTLAPHLEEPGFALGPRAAGLFGLIGFVGAGITPFVGRFCDRKGPAKAILAGALGTALAWALLGLSTDLPGLIMAVALLDATTRMTGIANQHRVFLLNEAARSRLNTLFVGAMFSGGAAGSAMAMALWQAHGWSAVSLLGVGLAAMAILTALWTRSCVA